MLNYAISTNTTLSITDIYKKFQERDVGHNIHTPYDLVDKILSKIGNFKNKQIAVLYTIEFALTLKDTYGADPKNITVFGDSEQKKKVAKRVGFNYYSVSVLYERDCDMKFDVVVGNPPYQDKKGNENSTNSTDLYPSFFDISDKITTDKGIISLIIPDSWYTIRKNSFKDRLFYSNKLKELEMLTYQKWFKVKKGVCNIIYDKTHNGKCTVIDETSGSTKEFDLNVTPFLNNDFVKIDFVKHFLKSKNLSNRWARGQLSLNEINETETGVKFIKACGRENQPLDIAIIDKKIESTGYGKWKVVMPNVGGTKGDLGNNVKIAGPEYVGGHSVVFLLVDTEKEAKNLISYLNTKPIRLLISMKTSSPNAKTMFELIPDVDLSKEYNDEDVYKLFNVSKELKKYVKSRFE